MSVTWIDDNRFRVDGIDFTCSFGPSTGDLFCIRKPRRLVEETVHRLDDLRPARVVELGIAQGGSAALIAVLSRPTKLVAIELDAQRVPALDELIARRSLDDRVRPYFGIDQGDRLRVGAIAEEEFRDTSIDLVIDDASHVLDATRASFETLFPRLRPGGRYVIEDWNWHQKFVFSLARKRRAGIAPDQTPGLMQKQGALRDYLKENLSHPPLETLVVELVLARACSGDAIGDMTVGEGTVVVERGPGALDPARFRVADTYVDPRGILTH